MSSPDQPGQSGGSGYPPSSSPASPGVQLPYPIQFSVDYPDRPLNRLTTGLRIFTAIPIVILLATVRGWLRGGGRPSHRGPAADDPLPAEIPAVVV